MKIFVIMMIYDNGESDTSTPIAYRDSEDGAKEIVRILTEHETSRDVTYEYDEISKDVILPVSNMLDPPNTVDEMVKVYSLELMYSSVVYQMYSRYTDRTEQMRYIQEFHKTATNEMRVEAIREYLSGHDHAFGTVENTVCQYMAALGPEHVLDLIKNFFDKRSEDGKM